ncbi:DUF7519 family protein [Halomicrobium zhouii]|nr:hypothetical protein [Halomicrobium zhouii]
MSSERVNGSMAGSEQGDETVRAVEVTHSPATVSSVLAVVAALVAVVASATSLLAMAVSAFGLVGVVAGLFAFESERAVAIGTGIVFVGVVLSGVFGNSLPLLVLGSLATVLSFDYGQNAFSVGSQLSDQTDTIRGEVVHAAASVVVGILIVGVAYGVYAVAVEGLSYGALAFLLFGGLLLVWGIRS